MAGRHHHGTPSLVVEIQPSKVEAMFRQAPVIVNPTAR